MQLLYFIRRAVGQQQTAKLQFGEIAASGISFTPPVNSTTTLTHWVDNEVYGNNTDGVVGLSHVTYDGVPWVLAIVLQTTLDDSAPQLCRLHATNGIY